MKGDVTDNKLDLRQIGIIFGHALYVDVADMPDFTETGEILSRRDLEEFKVRTTIQEAFGIPPSKPTMIDEEHIIRTLCPVLGCRATYTTEYSLELNSLPEEKRKDVLKRARMSNEAKAQKDHINGKHNVNGR